jgi:transposase
MQTLHRSRDRLVGERTAPINQLRAILLERGIVSPQGERKLEQFLAMLMDGAGRGRIEPADDHAGRLRARPMGRTRSTDRRLWHRVHSVDEREWRRSWLASILGVGRTIASALIAAIGKGETFEHGRDLAAW